MPRERFSLFGGDGGGGGGSSVADLIMSNGRAQADAELRRGAATADTINAASQALQGISQDYFKRRDDKKVQGAVRAAVMPGATRATPAFDAQGNPTAETTGPNVRGILDALPPELQGRAMKGIQDWQDMIGKRAESDARLTKLQQEIEETKKTRQQHDFDTLAVGAHHVTQLLDSDSPNAGLIGANGLYAAAKGAGLADDKMDTFMSGANEAWKAAQGDPQREAMFKEAFQAQAGPILEALKQRGSATVQEKFKPEVEKITTKNADGSETTELVPKQPGIIRTGARTPDTPGSEADYIRRTYGANPTPAQILQGREKFSSAGREPDVAMNLSPGALKQAAQLFVDTGSLPPAGMGKAGTAMRQAILNEAARLAPDANIGDNKAAFAADKASLTKLQGQTDAVAAFESTAGKNSKLLEDMLGKIPDSGTRLLNKPLRSLASTLGSEDMAAFNTIRQSVQNEYARIISNPTLAGQMSDSARKEGEALLSGDLTVGQLRSAIKTLQAEAKNRHSSYDEQIKVIKDRRHGSTPAASRYKVEVVE